MDAALARPPFALKQDNQRIAEIAPALRHYRRHHVIQPWKQSQWPPISKNSEFLRY
jgi:hypothetical protein